MEGTPQMGIGLFQLATIYFETVKQTLLWVHTNFYKQNFSERLRRSQNGMDDALNVEMMSISFANSFSACGFQYNRYWCRNNQNDNLFLLNPGIRSDIMISPYTYPNDSFRVLSGLRPQCHGRGYQNHLRWLPSLLVSSGNIPARQK